MSRPLINGALGSLALLALAAGPAGATGLTRAPGRTPAQTEPVALSFDYLVLDTPATPDAEIVSPASAPLTVTAQVDPSTGDFTIDPSDFSAPTYDFTSPIPGSATVALKDPATGTIDFGTGAVTLDGDFLATITLTGEGSCVKDTGPLTLSTAATQPLPGVDFPAGATGVATGAGALGASWTTLAPGTGTACGLVDGATNGPGGIWISRNLSPAQAQALVDPKLATTAPRTVKVTRRRTATVKVSLANSGAADTKSVKVCLKAPKPLTTTGCQTVTDPASKSTRTLTFKVATHSARAGHYRLSLTATGLATKTVSLTVVK